MSDFELDVDSLRDPDPRAPGAEDRDAVARRARGLRRRSRQRTGLVVGLCVVVGAGAIGVVVARRTSTPKAVVIAPAESTSVPARSALLVDTRCFPTTSRAPDEHAGATTAVVGWPTGASRLLVLERNGDLWVVDSGTATLWAAGATAHVDPSHTGYVWARFAADGSIYASRVGADNVEIDHLTAPGVTQVATTLPFTVKADTPARFCPINGYLSSFGISAQGFVLLKHQAGPWQHSCPAEPATVATDPWRCQSPYMISTEIRTDIAQTGVGEGSEGGGVNPAITTLVTTTDSNTIGTAAGDDALVETLDRDPSRGECCAGGPGYAFALTAHARQLVYATKPSQGVDLRITGPDKIPNGDQHLWTAPAPITSIAASSEWIAVAHGDTVTTLRLDGSDVSTPIVFQYGPVATLDWAPAH